MTDYLVALVLGVVEGVTEFLPVSSTGHLILVGNIINFVGEKAATFEIAIQLGAILAVVYLYFGYFWSLLNLKNTISKKHITNLILTSLPALVLGALCHHWIKTVLFSPFYVALALIIGGVVMIVVETLYKSSKTTIALEDISYKQALMIGFAQVAALWPGMSRSASTIVGGLISGLELSVAAQYSFVAAVPVITAAFAFELLKSSAQINSHDFLLIGIGFLVSFVTAILAIKTFIKLLTRFKLIPFAIYRIIIGIIILIVLN